MRVGRSKRGEMCRTRAKRKSNHAALACASRCRIPCAHAQAQCAVPVAPHSTQAASQLAQKEWGGEMARGGAAMGFGWRVADATGMLEYMRQIQAISAAATVQAISAAATIQAISASA